VAETHEKFGACLGSALLRPRTLAAAFPPSGKPGQSSAVRIEDAAPARALKVPFPVVLPPRSLWLSGVVGMMHGVDQEAPAFFDWELMCSINQLRCASNASQPFFDPSHLMFTVVGTTLKSHDSLLFKPRP
jgi:hypothetical protein